MNHSFKILQLAALDVTVKKFLLPLIERLRMEGYQVHIACSDGQYVPEFRERGYTVHAVNIERRINPVSNFRALWHLYRLMKREQFDIVHVHTPVAAALGRVAAWLARRPVIIYTVHGFYFHENMPGWTRRMVIFLERLLGRITHLVFTVSNEDALTAVREVICPRDRVLCIGAGVDVGNFNTASGSDGVRESLGLNARDKLVGFVGRLVREKGVLELVEAMKLVFKALPDAKLLLIGDTLNSERDRKTKDIIARLVNQEGLESRVLFTGFVEDVPRIMAAIDLLVLPSYREGMPVSVIEAMASGKPVVATNIRGCREEVVPGLTGLLVPVKDHTTLAEAIVTLLGNPELAHQMGVEGRRRACELFDERIVLGRQLKAYADIVRKKLTGGTLKKRRIQLWFKRVTDITLSTLSLTLLSVPFLLFAALIKIDSSGPVFFRQERAGKDGKAFLIWKFRTMIDGAVNHGLGLNVARDDSRLTRVGKLLRNWGFDELPQLINVFKGDMSIVGPRPALCYQAACYDDFQRQRLEFRPGITSLAVVSGRNLLSWKERIKLDVLYIHDWSLWLDWKIIVKTFWAALVTREGIYGPGGINDDFTAVETRSVSGEL